MDAVHASNILGGMPRGLLGREVGVPTVECCGESGGGKEFL